MIKNIRLLGLFNFFNDFRPYNAFAILYFAQVTNSFAVGTLVFSVATISTALFEVPTGVLSDFTGRKKIMLLGALSSTLAITLYAIGGHFYILALGAIFNGLSQALFSGNNNALLYDTLAEQNQKDAYPEWLGKTNSLFQVGLMVGALVGAVFAHISLAWVFWISVIPQSASIIVALFIHEPSIHNKKIETNIFAHFKESFQIFIHNKRLRFVSGASIIDWGVGQAIFEFEPAFVNALWPSSGVALFRAANHVTGWFSFWSAGKTIKKLSAHKVLVAGSIIGTTVMFVAYGFPTIFSPVLIIAASLLFGIMLTAQDSIMQKEFSDAQRATMGSLNSLAGNALFAVIVFLLGLVADRFGASKALLAAQSFHLVSLYLYWKVFKHRVNEVVT